MPSRLRLLDFRASRVAQAIVQCAANLPVLAGMVNSAQRRLLTCRETGDEGFYGCFAEMAFNINPTTAYVTTPRHVARLEKMAICKHSVPIQNQFYEYLDFGSGPQPNQRWPNWGEIQAYSRNNAVTFIDPPSTPFIVRIYPGDPMDAGTGLRVLMQGLDTNNRVIRSQEPNAVVDGVYLSIESPFTDTPMQMNQITGIQKDMTDGPVLIYSVNPTTGAETLILTMEPSETTACYRRYFINPRQCACACGNPTQVTAMAKLDLIPVQIDQDYLLIGNLEALTEECQAIRFSMMDIPGALQMEQYHHKQAIGYLNGELVHREGKSKPAVTFLPFGSARLQNQRIGTLI